MTDTRTIVTSGDEILGRHVNEVLGDADLLVNPECALSAEIEAWRDDARKVYSFRPDPDGGARTLDAAGVDHSCLADHHAGADYLWMHSAHVVQGIELGHGNPTPYDTGNFVDEYAVDPDLRNDISALCLIQVRQSAIAENDLLPVRIDYRQGNEEGG